MSTYSREDVQRSYHQGSVGLPMANVKVYCTLDDAWRDFARYEPDAEPRFNSEWLDEYVTEQSVDELFWLVCSSEFEQVQQDAAEIFGASVDVYQEGRNGGWAVVSGLADVEDWDAVVLAKWRRFERLARGVASDVPYQMLSSLYLNEFESWRTDLLEQEPSCDVPQMLAETTR